MNCFLLHRQENYSKADILYWSINHPERLTKVLPTESSIGNNKMGVLLMELRESEVKCNNK